MYTFNKGEVKKLNDFNQEAKNIFAEYTLYNEGKRIICVGINGKPGYGSHHIITNNDGKYSVLSELIAKKPLSVDSKVLFKTISTRKSTKILQAKTDDLFELCGSDFTDTVGISHVYKYDKLFEFNDETKDIMKLSSDSVEDLCNNKFLIYNESSKYRTRITRGLIPGLKKSHEIFIGVTDDPNNKKLYRLTIVNSRNDIMSFHNYTCVSMG